MKEIPLAPQGVLWSNGLNAKVDDEVSSISELCGDPLGGESNFSSL